MLPLTSIRPETPEYNRLMIERINAGGLTQPDPEMRLSTTVWEAARRWVLRTVIRDGKQHETCDDCGQTVYISGTMFNQRYQYTEDEQIGCIVSHMIQRHRWTREGPPRDNG